MAAQNQPALALVATIYQGCPGDCQDSLNADLKAFAHLQILYTVAALDIADILGRQGPQTAPQLASLLGAPSAVLTQCLSPWVTNVDMAA